MHFSGSFVISVHPETLDGHNVALHGHRETLHKLKRISDLRGGAVIYAALASVRFDAETGVNGCPEMTINQHPPGNLAVAKEPLPHQTLQANCH